MFKNCFILFIIFFCFLLTGCDAEKKITIANTSPEVLFSQTLATLKQEFPNSTISLDVPKRKIVFINKHNQQYPSNLEMLFVRNNLNTDIYLSAKEPKQDQFQNLQELLTASYEKNQLNLSFEATDNTDKPQTLRINKTR
jgi:uncharacterized lipoprotein YajG